jgi:glycosyltransferase involved in cell wall biosynthesis
MPEIRNILLLNETSGPGGAETVLFNIAQNLDRNRYNPRVVLFRPGWFKGFLEEHGIPVDIIPSRKSWDMSFVKRLCGYCREHKIDLIHAHLPGGNLYGSIAGKILHIPVICTLHNEFVMPGSVERFNSIKMFMVRNLASKLVIVAEFMRDDYLSKGRIPSRKMLLIYNGVRPVDSDVSFSLEDFNKAISYQEGDILIAHIANLRTPKGHNILIEAAARVLGESPKAKFLLIGEEGDGRIKSDIMARMKAHNIADRVILLGFRRDVFQILKHVDIFVLSSISEGLPVSVVEGMRSSLPVVATTVGGLPEVVKDGVSGYLVKPGDPDALAERLIALCKSPELRIRMGQKGSEIASEIFSLDTMISKYQALYEELMK